MKKGLIYTIAVFLILISLFELAAFSQEQSGRQLSHFYAPMPAQTIAWRLEELTSMSLDYAGISRLYFIANSTNSTLFFSDKGFPLTNSTFGFVYLDSLKSFVEADWANRTATTAVLDVGVPNSTGKIFSTTGGMHYYHTNTSTNAGEAYLAIPSPALIENLTLQIKCNRPSPSLQSPLCSPWAPTATSNYALINYSEGSTTCTFSDYFNTGANHALEAQYYAADGNWSHSVYIDWLSSGRLRIYTNVNTSKMAMNAVSCTWNMSLLKTRTSISDEKLYLPIIANLTFQNSSYSGNLTISRQ